MILQEALKLRITELMKSHNIKTIHELSLLAGIPYATINDFFTGRVQLLKIDKLVFICDVLHLQLKDFFNSSLFVDVECTEVDNEFNKKK